jgi:hypothetical protein
MIKVDHIICDHVGACVASTPKEIEWDAQVKDIFIGHFISSVIGV